MPKAKARPTIILSLDRGLSELPQSEINAILSEWQRERVLGIPAQKRLQQLLGVLKGERLVACVSAKRRNA
jgi:hypothetical protein